MQHALIETAKLLGSVFATAAAIGVVVFALVFFLGKWWAFGITFGVLFLFMVAVMIGWFLQDEELNR